MFWRELPGETDGSFRWTGCSGSHPHRRAGWGVSRPYAIPSTTRGVARHPWLASMRRNHGFSGSAGEKSAAGGGNSANSA